MKRFVILPNVSKDNQLSTSRLIIDWLERHHCQVYLPEDVACQLNKETYGLKGKALYEHADCAIVLGGDGTILYTARQIAAYDLPILGVNLGNLGFLAEVEKKDAIVTLKKIIDGDYYIQKRMMLNVSKTMTNQEEKVGLALNDIVIARSSISRMMKYSLCVNEGHVNDYSADGLIVSTPTGSTAYNLSAGGPILDPANEMMVITPICPHTLMSRSIVLSQNDEVRISLKDNRKSWNKDIILTIDGQENFKIDQEDEIIVSKSEHSAQLITCNKNGFYRILKKKLGNR
ncbi:NAD(+)/NADH kinase [Vallitalea pronyensis]|uniref:NAD kinase n=1 Tax=Vallitalea pronyensis TaxID=1348613 RepID=A0A8J8MLV9_9FIRM|nr:NAD(+)/NADH kinase [Vallitalea pronyensis]QUI23797.1 NAD(+)/NADH kinase [Vallitalea pronyensis]